MGPHCMAASSQGMGGFGLLVAALGAIATGFAAAAATSGNRGSSNKVPDPFSSSTVDDHDQEDTGGYKDNDKNNQENEEEGYDSEESESNEGYLLGDSQYRIRSFSSHIYDRFTRYIRLGGVIQRISERTGIPRSKIVRGGASCFQDDRSHRGRSIHAAHVIRVGEITRRLGNYQQYLLGLSSRYYNELANFLGHTQNVHRYANEWSRIGGAIDEIQSGNLGALEGINFRGNFTQEAHDIIENLRSRFANTLLHEMMRDPEHSDEYLEAHTILMQIDIREVFNREGKGGWTGRLMKIYQQKYKKRRGQ